MCLLNAPTLSFVAAKGLLVKPLFFQMLLGFSFNFGGYENSKWELGIPLAGIYWLWRLTVKPYVLEKLEDTPVSMTGAPLDRVDG